MAQGMQVDDQDRMATLAAVAEEEEESANAVDADEAPVHAIRPQTTDSPYGFNRGKKGLPCGKKNYSRGKKGARYGKKSFSLSAGESVSDSDTSSSSSDDSGSEDDHPSVKAVLAGPKKVASDKRSLASATTATAPAAAIAKSASASASASASSAATTSKSKSKSKPAPHLRRLRVADIRRQPSEAQKKRLSTSPAEDQPTTKRARSSNGKGGIPEPDDVRDSDIKSLEAHPVVIYLRRHTPVKPCGRCAECRKQPCGKCGSCKKNLHLTERSRARERCTANGCTKLTEEELDRYRRAYNSAYTVDVIERELRLIRSEFMAIQERTSKATSANPNSELRGIQQKQSSLISRLQALNEEDPVVIQQTPDGYECFLLSIQTLETERDRVARLIERRTCRDPPRIMSSRRQLRDFYSRKICNMTRLFATEMVARPYVSKLIEIADEHERLVDSFPQTETETQ